MDGVIKLSAFAIIGVLMALSLKQEKNSLGFLLGMALGIMVLTQCVQRIAWIVDKARWLGESLGEGSTYLGTLLKVMGGIYVCDFAAGICRDAGFGFLAGQLEILGKLTVLIHGLPVLIALIDQIRFLT